jgi:hypothetical protein
LPTIIKNRSNPFCQMLETSMATKHKLDEEE